MKRSISVRRWFAASGLLLLAGAGTAAAPPEPEGYHNEPYHAAVPLSLQGAQVLSTGQARALWQAKSAVFIDVLARPPRPEDLPADTIWHPKARFNIPGSIWLPDTGYGELAPVMETYFRDQLAKATHADRDRPLVFYCQLQCWMSWNAAKRAFSFGYQHVDWYPGGTDGWAAAHLPLEQREPVPRPHE